MAEIGIVIRGKKQSRLLLQGSRRMRFAPSPESLQNAELQNSLATFPHAALVFVDGRVARDDRHSFFNVRPIATSDVRPELLPVYIHERWAGRIQFPAPKALHRTEILGRHEMRIWLEAHAQIVAFDEGKGHVSLRPIPVLRARWLIIPARARDEGWAGDVSFSELRILGAPLCAVEYQLHREPKRQRNWPAESLVMKPRKESEFGSSGLEFPPLPEDSVDTLRIKTSIPAAFWHTEATFEPASTEIGCAIDKFFGRAPKNTMPYQSRRPKRARRNDSPNPFSGLKGGL